jgi:hypothetical protein
MNVDNNLIGAPPPVFTDIEKERHSAPPTNNRSSGCCFNSNDLCLDCLCMSCLWSCLCDNSDCNGCDCDCGGCDC